MKPLVITYDHTYRKIRDPVRSPIVKPVRGGLVVGSVTTSESPLLYVFFEVFIVMVDMLLLHPRWRLCLC
jgi:hypothetical protein